MTVCDDVRQYTTTCDYEVECAGCGARLSKEYAAKKGSTCPHCGCRDGEYAYTPRRFEDEDPEAADVLAGICNERSIEKMADRSRRLKPLFLTERWEGEQKVGRNDPCPCGSGKKAKRCDCGYLTR